MLKRQRQEHIEARESCHEATTLCSILLTFHLPSVRTDWEPAGCGKREIVSVFRRGLVTYAEVPSHVLVLAVSVVDPEAGMQLGWEHGDSQHLATLC